jgi:hypothetical protein
MRRVIVSPDVVNGIICVGTDGTCVIVIDQPASRTVLPSETLIF